MAGNWMSDWKLQLRKSNALTAKPPSHLRGIDEARASSAHDNTYCVCFFCSNWAFHSYVVTIPWCAKVLLAVHMLNFTLTKSPISLLDMSLQEFLSMIASCLIIFGGVMPYIPQYLDIVRSRKSDGFSLFVCLTLLIANTLRILFWSACC